MQVRIDNEFLNQAQRGKNEWYRFLIFIIILIILFVFSFVIIQQVVDKITESFNIKNELYQTPIDLSVEGFQFLLVLTGVFFAIRKIHKRNFLTLNYIQKLPIKEFVEGFFVWGIIIIIGSLINKQNYIKYFLDNAINISLFYIVPIAIVSIFIQSYTEEVIFRGYILQSFSLKTKNKNLLILIPSFLFGVLHAADGISALIMTTLFGCLLSYIVLSRQNLGFTSGVHFINNFFFVYLLVGDDEVMAETKFFDFDFIDSAITLTQFSLVFLYIRYKQQKHRRLTQPYS